MHWREDRRVVTQDRRLAVRSPFSKKRCAITDTPFPYAYVALIARLHLSNWRTSATCIALAYARKSDCIKRETARM